MTRLASIAIAAFLALSGLAGAVEPDEMLGDPALEARAQKLDAQLRCVVCQSQSIAESNAPLAKDLRLMLRERLKAGDTDREAVDFLVARYGEYVLLKPRFRPGTLLLWTLPIIALGAGGVIAFSYLNSNREKPALAALDAEDEERLRQILKERG